MQKSAIISFLLILTITQTFAQNCSCNANLDSVIIHLSGNYPGMMWKDIQSEKYQMHVQKYRNDAEKTIGGKACQVLINGFLSWFKDGHLGVSYSGEVFKRQKLKVNNLHKWTGLTEENAKLYLDSLAPKDSFSGIWESYESFYKVLIVPKKVGSGFDAFIISTINGNWKAGELKMEFKPNAKGKMKCTFYTSDHSEEQPKFKLDRNLLEIDKITVWNKVYPKTTNPVAVESFVSSRFKWTQEFRPWSKEVFYVQLQNLASGVKPLIDSLVLKSKILIESSKILILDLRDNEGGDLTVFEPFWPFVLSKPAILYGTTYLCTSQNVNNYFKQILALDGQIEGDFLDFANEMRSHEGSLWNIPNDTLFPDLKNTGPEKVILLVNENCKSSTEDFILTAKSSSKVIVAGQNTGGVADFEEVVDVNLPCPELILYHPIGFSNRLINNPIDGKGIQPDILLTTKGRAWQTWVREILKRIQ